MDENSVDLDHCLQKREKTFVKSICRPRMHTKDLNFLFLNHNIFCGYSKEPFEQPKRMLKVMGKKIITFLCSNILSKPMTLCLLFLF